MRRGAIHFVALSAVLALVLALAGCGGSDDSTSSTQAGGQNGAAQSEAEAAQRAKPEVAIPDGPAPKKLVKKELIEGTGEEAKAGDEVTVQYVGALYKNGEEFDASWNRGEPFTFTLGAGEVIPGWEEGVEGMKGGGQRELSIPPSLGYGSQAVGSIPPNSTLVFVVDLLSVE